MLHTWGVSSFWSKRIHLCIVDGNRASFGSFIFQCICAFLRICIWCLYGCLLASCVARNVNFVSTMGQVMGSLFLYIYICMVKEVKVFMPRYRCISWHCYKRTCTFLWKGEGSLRSRRKSRANHFVNVHFIRASEESLRSRRKGHCFRVCHCVDTLFFYHLSCILRKMARVILWKFPCTK